jgi:putative flippase GtrA
MFLKNLLKKYKSILFYLFFGVCTTLINIAVYWLFEHVVHIGVMPSTIIAWFAAVLFAYLTNRKWVFHSETATAQAILAEMLAFFSCRLATGVIDWIIMYVFVDCLHWNDLFVKTTANLVVIVLNYIASKLLIFRK